MGRHEAPGRSVLPAIVGAVAVLVIAAAAFLGFRVLSSSSGSAAAPLPSSDTTPEPGTSSASTAPTSTTSTSPTTTATTSPANAVALAALQSCVTRQAAAKDLVAATTTGVDHWTAHLQGETDIESGARTYIDVKTNTWGPTRAAGPGDVAAFDKALAGYQGVGGCQNVAQVPTPNDVESKLKACATHQQALDAYVQRATAVMGDWRTHLTEMAAHADGHMAGPEAQATWIKRWREAPINLDPYKAAAAALSASPPCAL